MDPVRFAINRPVTVAVGIILVMMFGLIGVRAIPIQLTPTVDRPTISVTTAWPGRSPQEIVDEITREQEKRLKNVTNLKSMRSISRDGAAEVTLEFYVGSNINRALQEVSDSLRQVPAYPDEVDEPVIKAAEGAAQNAIAWIIIDLNPATAAAHPTFDITTIYDNLDREVKPFLERIDGVAEVNIYGGREREVRVLLDPQAMALRSLSHEDVIRAIMAENRNTTAGTISEGKRDYRVRVMGQYVTTQDVLDTIVAYRQSKPVYVRDLGTAEIGHDKMRGFVRSMGVPCIAMNVIRQSGANVVSVMEEVRERIKVIRTDYLPRMDPDAGPDLQIRQVYDETVYIDSAIHLVQENLWVGGLLSVLVLLVFLRSPTSTLIIAIAIPVCVVGTFLVLLACGRTLNVVSLAGLAFSTGVVVDNSIVVLENIERRRSLGDPLLAAVYRGSKEVWGAILAGTLCHVAVFIPILTVKDEAGQLFFDLTLALSVSILLSLIVAIAVVPAAEAVLARLTIARKGEHAHLDEKKGKLKGLFGIAKLADRLTASFSVVILWLITGWRAWVLRPAIIVAMTLASIFGSKLLMPPLDYLPAGNQNLVFGGLLVPPGLSMEQQIEYARRIEKLIGPYGAVKIGDPTSVAALPPIPRFDAPGKMFNPVPIEQFFVGGFQGGVFVGATSQDPQRVIPIANLLTVSMMQMPDAFGGARQSSIFGQGVGGGNTINMEISGPDLTRVTAAAQSALMQCAGLYTFGNVQGNPSNFNLTQQEMQVRLSRTGHELGLRAEDLGVAVRGLFDGAFAGEFRLDGRNADIKVLPREGRLDFKESMQDVPVATPGGATVPLGSVASIIPALAPQEIQRIEELPSVTIQISPPNDRALESVMNELSEKVVANLKATGLVDPNMIVRLEGTAAKLDQAKAALLGAPATDGPPALWQRLLAGTGLAVVIIGLAGAAFALVRGGIQRRATFIYGASGLLGLGAILGGLILIVADQPQLLEARMVWTLLVTYLLMCALFESFLYPFIIMFSVPFGIVGGFAALRLVHVWTLSKPESAPQQFDVLTMIGFVILIGTVVNNAILLVEQARNFMGHHKIEGLDSHAMNPRHAIAESVRTRVRPILMTTLTTVMGGVPLVVSPGAGSEMYRGLGAVILGGLIVSTVFTLVLVPMVFSLVLDMVSGVKQVFKIRDTANAPDDHGPPGHTLADELKSPAMPHRHRPAHEPQPA
ncbi:MAG TPA: efflux RND transporter permease subunit [Phycisphaerales bacterium]|nr:efflux RND transporter permease subunit [Phycisphaerales bacterium]